MARRQCFLGSVAFFCALVYTTAFAGNTGRQLWEIGKSCTAIDSSLKSGVLTPRFFAVLSVQPEAWKEYPTEKDLETACPKGCYRKVTAYFKGNSPVFVSAEFTGYSKEWLQSLKYYFREDGTLEKIHSEFKRFGAYEKEKGSNQQFLVRVIRDRFYDPRGKCIKKSSPRFFNVSRGSQVKDVVFKDEPWPTYVKVDKLPFFNLIQATSTPTSGVSLKVSNFQ